jgi:hypothetical protein
LHATVCSCPAPRPVTFLSRYLIEDKVPGAPSYESFLVHVHGKIKQRLANPDPGLMSTVAATTGLF